MYEIFNATGINPKKNRVPVVVDGQKLVPGASMNVEEISKKTQRKLDNGELLKRNAGSTTPWRSMLSLIDGSGDDYSIPEQKKKPSRSVTPVSKPVVKETNMSSVDPASLGKKEEEVSAPAFTLDQVDGLNEETIAKLGDLGVASVEELASVKRNLGKQISEALEVSTTVVREWVKSAKELTGGK